MKIMFRALLLYSLIGLSAWAAPGGQADQRWSELRGRCAGLSAHEDAATQIVDLCIERGMTVTDADALLAPVHIAESEALPVCCIIEKIDEGLSKQASVSNIIQAVETRLACMRQAKEIISSVVEGAMEKHNMGPARLLENTGMAIESGLDPDVLRAVITHNGHRKLGRLAHVIDAAEALHLEGVEDQHIQLVMIDFVDRNLSRHEMYRVVDILATGLESGRDFEAIYSTLWVPAR